MIPVLAGAFLTFLGFLFAGLLALGVTAALDRSLGKEKALLLFTAVLFGFTMWQCAPAPIAAKGRPRPEGEVGAEVLAAVGQPFERPDLMREPDSRNPFQKHSDTRPLDPIVLKLPPWRTLPYELPSTVPGPAPIARRVLCGTLPSGQTGDGSSIPEIPDPVFADYTPVPDDIYDWVFSTGRKTYGYIRSIRVDGRLYEEGDEGFLDQLHELANRETGWEAMQVEYAFVGSEETAAKKLERTAILRARLEGVNTTNAGQFDRWYLRRSVENLYREALRSNGLPLDPSLSSDISALRGAAAAMGVVGTSGKEEKEGWRRAASLLELAMDQARGRATTAVQAEILEELVEAYVELRSEKAVLRVLAEYARTSPGRPEPWLWLGKLHLRSLGLPQEALAYFEMALARSSRNADALLGLGDALTALGRHEGALEAYRKAGGGTEAKIRQAEAHLRLGNLQGAEFALAGAIPDPEPVDSAAADGADGEDAMGSEDGADGADAAAAAPTSSRPSRPLILLGAVLYARGDLDKAKDAFLEAATSSGPGGLEFRAQALYNLGLTCWRLGETDAAVMAFEACDKALLYGSAPGRFEDETVSPAFGRALIELASGNVGGMRSALQESREEAPRVSYHETLAGMVASGEQDHAGAVRAFDRALRLVYTYPNLDGWLAKTRLALGRGALRAGTPIEEAASDFEAAVAFAARASRVEEKADSKAFDAMLREAWILLQAEHLPARRRFEAARVVVRKVLKRIDREQPGALCILGYADYRLADFGLSVVGQDLNNPWDACIRDFQQVLNKVPADDEGEWRPWRDYAVEALDAVKHWLNLEEKIISFEEASLPPEWKLDESGGVKAQLEDGVIRLAASAKRDGSIDEPIFVLSSAELFKVGTFEEVRLEVKIPSRNAAGTAINTISFGVQVQRASARGSRRTRYSGIGVFYDRGKVALRVGGGQMERYKDGALHRLNPEMDWPSDAWVEVRIVRLDAREGLFQVFLDSDPSDGQEGSSIIVDDEGHPYEAVSGFKGGTRTNAELWIGGWSNQAQEYEVEIRNIRVIRQK